MVHLNDRGTFGTYDPGALAGLVCTIFFMINFNTFSSLLLARRLSREVGRERLAKLYRKLLTARLLELKMLDIRGWDKGIKRIYYGIGQEAGPIAVADLLGDQDYLVPAYRGVAHVVGRGMSPEKIIAEILGKSGGPLEGLGNPGNFTDSGLNVFPNCDAIGNNFGVAVGMGLNAVRDRDAIVALFFGDGAATRSPFYGALNLSVLWNLPILWVCENNKYCLATWYDQMSKTGIAEKAAKFGTKSEIVDGNNIVKIFQRAQRLVSYIRKERKPALLELDTYRITRSSEADTYWYRDKKEWQAWKERDPVKFYEEILALSGLFSYRELEDIRREVQELVERQAKIALEMPVHDAETIRNIYRFDNSKVDTDKSPTNYFIHPSVEKTERFITCTDALKEALWEEMEREPSILLIGEDVGFYGGRRGVTRGFLEKFGRARVLDTPLNEELFAGIALGAAQTGLRPVVEFSHAAFLLTAASDIHRLGFWDVINLFRFKLPIVIRASFGSGYDEYGEELAARYRSGLRRRRRRAETRGRRLRQWYCSTSYSWLPPCVVCGATSDQERTSQRRSGQASPARAGTRFRAATYPRDHMPPSRESPDSSA